MADLILLLFIGFLAGIFTGFFGVGGGFFLTPVLNILGLQIVYAIGTSFFVLIGNSLFGAWAHFKHDNVILKLGLIVGLASIGGVEIGKMFVLYLEQHGLAGPYIRIAYMIILLLVPFFMLREYFRYNNLEKKNRTTEQNDNSKDVKKGFISKIKLAPIISLPQTKSGFVSLWILLFGGFVIGFVSGILGVGGGFISLPFLIYVIGVQTIEAVGTSLIIVLLTSVYGTFTYALTGHVDVTTGLILLLGSLLGVKIGVSATRVSTDAKIKVLFALLLLSVAVSVFLKQIERTAIGSYLVVAAACLLCLIILWPLWSKWRLSRCKD